MKISLIKLLALFCFSVCFTVVSPVIVFGSDNIHTQELEANGAGTVDSSSTVTIPIPYKKDDGLSGADVGKFLFAFIFVLMVAFAAVFALRKYMYGNLPLPKGESKNIYLVEAKRLSPKLMVFLVDVQGEKVLLAQCGDTVVLHNHKNTEKSGEFNV